MILFYIELSNFNHILNYITIANLKYYELHNIKLYIVDIL